MERRSEEMTISAWIVPPFVSESRMFLSILTSLPSSRGSAKGMSISWVVLSTSIRNLCGAAGMRAWR